MIVHIMIILFVYFFFPYKTYASLKLNEIYPAPVSSEFEWVEIYNDATQSASLNGYKLLDASLNTIALPPITIAPLSYIVATSSGILNNTGDTITLKNNLGETIEVATYSGTFTATKSSIKCPDGIGAWYSSNFQTKGITNATACLQLTPTPNPSPTPEPIDTPIPTEELEPTEEYISYDNLIISEALVYPSQGEHEWVEIYNGNDFSVQLDNWFIDDETSSGSSPKPFSIYIPSKSYISIELSTNIFNNSGDVVRLLDFQKVEKDSFEYIDSEKGKTWGRIALTEEEYCLQESSRGMENNSCVSSPSLTPLAMTRLKITDVQKKVTQIPLVSPGVYKKVTPFSTTTRIVQKEKHAYLDDNVVLGAVHVYPATSHSHPLTKSLFFSSSSLSLLLSCSFIYKIKKQLIV